MVFFKNIEVRDLKHILGGTQRGLFAQEEIKKGEKIWHCDCGEKDGVYTRTQLLGIIAAYPKLDYFVRSFSYMVGDDLYALPFTYAEEQNNDECALFNHSCTPNVGFADEAFGDNVVALRNIEPGDELVYHYGFLETETSLIQGMECKCKTPECGRRLTFDYYRDPTFVDKYYAYMTPYLKKKVHDMKERWYNTSCYVKRYPLDFADNIEEWSKRLVAMMPIKKGELVASFSGEVLEVNHYLTNSDKPNCMLSGKDVVATEDIEPETDITLFYHGCLL